MKKTLKWRLGKLPTSDEVLELVKADLITKDEGREIMFNQETEEDVKIEDLKHEIKFLREIVEKLSEKNRITEIIHTVNPIYVQYPWYQPYYYWASSAGGTLYTTTAGGAGIATTGYCQTDLGGTVSNAVNSMQCNTASMSCGSNQLQVSGNSDLSFSQIQTF